MTERNLVACISHADIFGWLGLWRRIGFRLRLVPRIGFGPFIRMRSAVGNRLPNGSAASVVLARTGALFASAMDAMTLLAIVVVVRRTDVLPIGRIRFVCRAFQLRMRREIGPVVVVVKAPYRAIADRFAGTREERHGNGSVASNGPVTERGDKSSGLMVGVLDRHDPGAVRLTSCLDGPQASVLDFGVADRQAPIAVDVVDQTLHLIFQVAHALDKVADEGAHRPRLAQYEVACHMHSSGHAKQTHASIQASTPWARRRRRRFVVATAAHVVLAVDEVCVREPFVRVINHAARAIAAVIGDGNDPRHAPYRSTISRVGRYAARYAARLDAVDPARDRVGHVHRIESEVAPQRDLTYAAAAAAAMCPICPLEGDAFGGHAIGGVCWSVGFVEQRRRMLTGHLAQRTRFRLFFF